MKQRTKRDFLVFIGVVGLLGAVAFFNTQLRRGNLAQQYEELRENLEAGRTEEGLNLLNWKTVRTTKGTLRKGGRYSEDLMAYNNEPVHMIGFMVPTAGQFRDVTEFMMLPIPIECYFCSIPPARDVLFVLLEEGETAQIYAEPVLILGNFTIHEGPDQTFFYSLREATFEAAEDGGELTKRRLKLQHMVPNHERGTDDLLDPYKGRKVDNENTD